MEIIKKLLQIKNNSNSSNLSQNLQTEDRINSDSVTTDGGTPTATSSGSDTSEFPPTDTTIDTDFDHVSEINPEQLTSDQIRGLLAELQDERDIAQDRVVELEEETEELKSNLQDKEHHIYDLEGSLAELQGVITANADGNLTRRADINSDVDMIVELVSTYNRMVEDWNNALEQVQEASYTVDESTTDVAEEIQSVEEGSEEVSTSVDEIAQGAETQSDDLNQILSEMESLSATIEEMAASTNQVASNADRAVSQGDEAQQSAAEAVEVLESMEAESEEMVSQVERLDELMSDIEEITEFITDIAEQTNMLALNANIEAARAGSEGDGFGVVADEVKSLATETKEATGEIAETVQTINEETSTTVEQMHSTQEAVGETQDVVQSAIVALDEVVEMTNEANQSIQEINTVVDEQASVTQSVVSMVEDVSSVSEETSAAAHNVSQAATDQAESLVEIADEVNTISGEADELEQTSSQFEIGERTQFTPSRTDTVVEFWHAMGGAKSLLLTDLAREFEAQYDGVHFKLSSLGSYDGVLNETLAAVENGNGPAVAQINEIGSMQARQSDAFKPAGTVLPKRTVSSLVDSVKDYYTVDGVLQSVPFNSSNPILCINADLFREAGLDPTSPPETLEEVRAASEQLVNANVADYGISFANYSWFVEQWFAEDGQELVNAGNGREGIPTQAHLDSETGEALFDWWVAMEEQNLYHNPGIKARGAAKKAFHDGRAAMLIGSTSSLDSITDGASFDLNCGYLPVIDDREGVLVGGASLWINDSVSKDVESALSDFFTWLLEPEQQARWHRETGYFPVTSDAIDALRRDGWFDNNPHYATAFKQFQESKDTPATNGAQMGPFPEVRSIIESGRASINTPADVSTALTEINNEIKHELQTN